MQMETSRNQVEEGECAKCGETIQYKRSLVSNVATASSAVQTTPTKKCGKEHEG